MPSLVENRSFDRHQMYIASVQPKCVSGKTSSLHCDAKVDAVFDNKREKRDEKKIENKMKQVWLTLQMNAVSQHLSNVFCMQFQYVQFFCPSRN